MPFGFARINRGALAGAPRHVLADPEPRDQAAPAPGLGEHEQDATEFLHVHGDTCSCNLRGE